MDLSLTDYLRFFLALGVVLGLIALTALMAKRLGFGNQTGMGRGTRRLGMVESLMIDSRRRLILVRRDSTEHLILVGPTSDLLVETGIPASAPTAMSSQAPTGAPQP
jgi:flagellar protein FliO/FliZ